MTEDQWWRSIINGLDIQRDLEGEPVFLKDEPEEEERDTIPDVEFGDKPAGILRFKMDIYVISPQGTNKAYMVTGKSSMEDAGIMTVKEALKLIERRKKR